MEDNLWINQKEAIQFAMSRNAVMLDMDMGTGKTRVAIEVALARSDVHKILVVCPKAVIRVWRENLLKFHNHENWVCWDDTKGTITNKTKSLVYWFEEYVPKINDTETQPAKQFVIINYDAVWRTPIGDFLYKKCRFDMVILDESHRAKAAGSKVSKYLSMLGKSVKYRMCLSGTPLANSPLDVYGQYRFLDPFVFGTNYRLFLQEYAVMGGPDLNFVVGFKNQRKLKEKFDSLAYHCKMSDIADRIKLPEVLPPTLIDVCLPSRDRKTIKDLSKEFVAECGFGHVVVNNILVSILRMQQICSGFCFTKESVFDNEEIQELNTSKEDSLFEILNDISPEDSVVVFCKFRHDLEAINRASQKGGREYFELSGSSNMLDQWKEHNGAVMGVQIQAGAEGVDMTKANHAIYFSLPHSLAMYEQSKARLYRPGQTRPVSFTHLIVRDTIDEAIYNSLVRKEDIIESIKAGTFDFGYLH